MKQVSLKKKKKRTLRAGEDMPSKPEKEKRRGLGKKEGVQKEERKPKGPQYHAVSK